jgi:anion transporter
VGAIEYGLTALCGCFLFWALRVTSFDMAFSGFVQPTTWFIFAALLTGQAVTHTGLAKRLGYLVIRVVGCSYRRLLFGILALALCLALLIPSNNPQIVIMAAVVIGLINVFGAERSSNIATGLFLAMTMGCAFFSQMFLSGNGVTILAYGLIERHTGLPILWSHWALAFLPITLLTLGALWAVLTWLYPPETPTIPGGQQAVRAAAEDMGPWSQDERKTLCWVVLALALWGTDSVHHLPPTLIGISLGLLLAFPKVGVLKAGAIKSVDISLVIFMGGALSLSHVLVETQDLAHLTSGLVNRVTSLLIGSWSGPLALYGSGLVYQLLSAHPFVMIGTGLPVLLDIAMHEGLNPLAVGLVWLFASTPKLFVYQTAFVILAYSYGYFRAASLLKVGAILAVVEGLCITMLVPL